MSGHTCERPELSLDELLSQHDSAERAASVASIAGGLAEAGVGAGDVVAWQLPNGDDPLLLYRACWRIGAVAAPIHQRATAHEAARLVATIAPKLLVGSELPRGTPIAEPSATRDGLGVILFTAGSSGTPKAVLHTRAALAYKAALMVAVHGLTPHDAVLMPAPLAHVSGLLNGVLVPGAVPCRTVFMERWDPEVALGVIERERITFMVGPPTFFVSLWREPGFAPERVTTLRLISCGGAGVTEAFCREATQRLGARVKRTYGSTEAPTVATSTDADAEELGWRHDGRAVGSAELKVDPATGELLVRGPEVCAGYLNADQTAAAVTRDGWFRTGDLATITADGWLTITGRSKDVIIRGGENIATAEVESVLEAHPAINQAVAVGFPDPLMGERVCAFVVTSAPFDLDDCRAWFAERAVAKFKTPERVIVVDALPALPSGKPDRLALKSRAQDVLASEAPSPDA